MTMSTRKKVKIPDKAWLDSFKFLMGPQWQKVRFVSRQLDEVVKGNISELPRIIIDNVKFSDIYMHSKPIELIASGMTISSDEKREWFMKRGINPDAPTDLQHQDAIGMNPKYGNLHKRFIYYCACVNELGGESMTHSIQISTILMGPMEYFLIALNPLTYIKIYMHSKPIEMIASGMTISSDEKREWFMKRGINPDAPTDLQHQDAVIGMNSKYGNLHKRSIYYCAYEHRKPMLFSAAFNPDLNEYSWASMEYFLNLLYNPLTYIKEVEMYALNKNLTDAFFLGEDYGSYIRCGRFTLIGDLCKSLPWIHKNVRADTICLPGDYTDKENSYKEATNFLLDTPWTCANQNVKTVNIELEWVRHWKWLIKSLLKKFRTLATIDHDTPSIEFPFYKEYWETLKLNFLIWDPEVVKMEPDDSQGTKTVYVVSNGRNKMVIAIFKRAENMDAFSSLPISYRKRAKAIYDVSVKTYTIESATLSREKVHIFNDTWLEALKFLSFPQWSKALFVSRQLAGVVQRNISRLPCIVIDSATMSQKSPMCTNAIAYCNNDEVVAFNDRITFAWQNRFFTELGISLNAPADVQHENALLDSCSNNFCSPIWMRLRGIQRLSRPIIFSAQFSKHNEHSWAALKYFLEFLYYPAVYTKEVEMFALNQKMVDDLFEAEKRFIRCGAFTLRGETESSNMDEFRKSLSWIEQNVRANTIHFPEHIDYKNENVYEPIANFLLDASWKCARQEVNFKCICNADSFVEALIEKFRSVSFIRKDIPMFTFSLYGNDETLSFLELDPNVLKLSSYGADEYVISNGNNRMQIEIFEEHEHGISYRHRKYHDNWQNEEFQKLEVYIKVNVL
ncbi:hypothetical protein Ddc_22432 [Ditylenchus destructor]|nr:hypothetical protein Ddc_22432 [Ditylenchus destructor]